MTQVYEYFGLFSVLFWIVFRILFPFVSNFVALIITGIVVCISSIVSPDFLYISIAIFAPFGALLPILAIQNIAGKLGKFPTATYSTIELVLVLILYVCFLAASLGVMTVDPYRYGYSPTVGSVIAFGSCCYVLWRGYYAIAIALVLGQLAWSFDVGSTNYFDHVTHATLVLVIAITLIKRTLIFVQELSNQKST